ncbi:hypothetical protein QQ045_004161 [Rhodiola kirilowii]
MTKDRMRKWGFVGDRTCVLCNAMEESRDHLFFGCRFTWNVLTEVMKFLNVKHFPSSWDLLIPWFKGLSHNHLKTRMIAAAITRAMNGLWTARNAKIFQTEETMVTKIARDTIWYLKMKIGAIKKDACSRVDLIWMTDMRFIDGLVS